MKAINNTLISRRYLQSGGIHQATVVDDSEEQLFKMYYDFAYYHVKNAMEMYENAAGVLQARDQKVLFAQLACRKKEVLDKLKMSISGMPPASHSARKNGTGSFTRYVMDVDLSPIFTLKEAFEFLYGKETKTLSLYEKLAKTAHIFSTKMLFDYLIESQRRHILYLDSQLAISNGDLDRLIPAEMELEYASG